MGRPFLEREIVGRGRERDEREEGKLETSFIHWRPPASFSRSYHPKSGNRSGQTPKDNPVLFKLSNCFFLVVRAGTREYLRQGI